jgi:hypothetical protein
VALLCAVASAAPSVGGATRDEREAPPPLRLAAAGRPLATIVLPSKPLAVERNAAQELADYLERITSARFEITSERKAPRNGPTIEVGPTRAGRRRAACADGAPEQWVIAADADTLILCGGRPRGTLYAVYRFLEDHLGVRWWNPWDETVPRRDELVLPPIAESGQPAFLYRDVYLEVFGPHAQRFAARSRLNGDFTALTPDWGGRHAFGPPHHVHTFFMYAPPRELFSEHPEWFTEHEAGDDDRTGSLCLADPELRRHLERRLRSYVEDSTRKAEASGESRPSLFSFSHNDWPGACDCPPCRPLVAREGESGVLVDTVNALAARIAGDYPGVRLETLAYRETIEPPPTLRTRPDVVVRLAELFEQNFTLPVTDPGNSFYRRVLNGWLERTSHLWIWEYPTTFSRGAGLPLANLGVLAANFRYYQERGVEGVYAQFDHSILAHLRDLSQWVMAKLIEDPRRDPDALILEFTEGYYGAAGTYVRDYLKRLERAMAAKPTHIGYPNRIEDWRYLDAGFLMEAQALFERAEQAVGEDPVGLRRVRFARLALDRATLLRWPIEFGDISVEPPGLDPVEIVLRARATAHVEIDARCQGGEAERQRELIDRQLRRSMEKIGFTPP